MGRLCYPILPRPKRRGQASGQGPGISPEARPESCHGARRVWRTFCSLSTNFIEHYACRGTRLIGAANLSPVTKLVAGTGAVSRYKLSRSQKFVKVQDFNCGQMSVSGCIYHYKFILGPGVKAKSVTNNLPILSVLANGRYVSILIKIFFQSPFIFSFRSCHRYFVL